MRKSSFALVLLLGSLSVFQLTIRKAESHGPSFIRRAGATVPETARANLAPRQAGTLAL